MKYGRIFYTRSLVVLKKNLYIAIEDQPSSPSHLSCLYLPNAGTAAVANVFSSAKA